MADIIPHKFITQQANKNVDFINDTIRCILCSGTYSEEILRDVESYYDLSAYEITSGGGYVIGGVVVSGTSAYNDNVNNRTVYVCGDVTFNASGGNLLNNRFAAMYDVTANNTVVYLFDFERDRDIFDGANLTIRMDNTGFMKAYQG